jgi:hypothetical protein
MNSHLPLLILTGASLAGCATPSMPDMDKTPAPAASTGAAAAGPVTRASALSYGTVTARVEKNKTTQTDLLEQFGGPNISSVDSDGAEVWVYERSVNQTDVATQSKDYLGAVNMGVSFGYPHFGASAGASGSAEKRSGQSSTTTSTRTLTVIVKFNADKTVKDYSARATTF